MTYRIRAVIAILIYALSGYSQIITGQSGEKGKSPGSLIEGESPRLKTAPQESADCGCEANSPAGIAATINNTVISLKDVDSSLTRFLKKLESQVSEARRRKLQEQIASKILQSEAEKRGLSVFKLIQQEVNPKVLPPTLEEVSAFYEQNKSYFSGEFDRSKPVITLYLAASRLEKEKAAFAQKLRQNAQVNILTEIPPARLTEPDRARVLATVNGEPI
jgi:hypothetical protein